MVTYKELIFDESVPKQICPNLRIDEESLFCLMYTSGSTGRPKGVRLPYRALLNRLQWQWRIFPFNSQTIFVV